MPRSTRPPRAYRGRRRWRGRWRWAPRLRRRRPSWRWRRGRGHVPAGSWLPRCGRPPGNRSRRRRYSRWSPEGTWPPRPAEGGGGWVVLVKWGEAAAIGRGSRGAPLTSHRPWAGGTEDGSWGMPLPKEIVASTARLAAGLAVAAAELISGGPALGHALGQAASPQLGPSAGPGLGREAAGPSFQPFLRWTPSLSPVRAAPVGIAVICRLLNHGSRTSASLKCQRLSQFLRGERGERRGLRFLAAPQALPCSRAAACLPLAKRAVSWESSAPSSWSFLQVPLLVFREMGRKHKRKGKAFPFHKKLRSQRHARLTTATVQEQRERQPLSLNSFLCLWTHQNTHSCLLWLTLS